MLKPPIYGLVLGGGGVRGGAHLGALRVLDELGYRPDLVVGSSMGAIIASLVGVGKTLAEIETFLLTNDFNELIYPERSGNSLLGNERIIALLTEHLGDADLRDLSPRIAVMGTDLATKQRVILQEGSAVTAVLASMSLPGSFRQSTGASRC